MIRVVFPDLSNQADWLESMKLVGEDDGQPVWTTVPVDLVATLTVRKADRDGRGCCSSPVLTVTATGAASGELTAFDSGFLEIAVPADSMSSVEPGVYEVLLSIETGGVIIQAIIGCMNVICGA